MDGTPATVTVRTVVVVEPENGFTDVNPPPLATGLVGSISVLSTDTIECPDVETSHIPTASEDVTFATFAVLDSFVGRLNVHVPPTISVFPMFLPEVPPASTIQP